MEENNITERMQEKGVKPTSNRILIMKTLIKESRPMSLSDIEETLPTMDKSSIFRVLSIFLKHHIVHSFEDGRGILNYELCTHRGICNNSEAHIHFYCKLCHKSFCMKDIPMQDMELPLGFIPHSTSFVIKGLCPKCARTAKA